MASIIAVHLLNGIKDFADCGKRKKAFAGGKKLTEAGFLGEDGPAGSKIASAAIAEPSASRNDVAAFCDPKLCFRALNEVAITRWRTSALEGIKQFPIIFPQRLYVIFFIGVNREREGKFLSRHFGKFKKLSQRVCLLAVVQSTMFDGSVTAPVADGRERVVKDSGSHRPILQNNWR